MQNLVQLSTDEIKAMSYDEFNLIDLKAMQSLQGEIEPRCSVAMGHLMLMWENVLYQIASNLTDQYSGGLWTTEHGFWVFQSDDVFLLSDGYGREFQINALEFSIVVNIKALSNIAISTYQSGKQALNRRSVFFSDYIKDFMNKNRSVINTQAIYFLTD